MTNISDLDTPALLIEESIVNRNIERMQALANRHGVGLRPHIKTHKMIALAKRQLEAGARGIAVAKLGEAEVMAKAGITDIQIANEIVGPKKLARLRALCKRATVSCAVDDPCQVPALAEVGRSLGQEIALFVEIDTGLHRCGLSDDSAIVAMARLISATDGVRWRGILTHAGHAYAAGTPDEVARIGQAEGGQMVRIAEMLRGHGLSCPEVSVGSTPTVAFSAAIEGVTEIRPGNYIFNDMMQVRLGSAGVEDCALSLLATVISRPSPDRAVLDVGSKALTLDRGAHGNILLSGFGYLPEHDCWLTRLSEEHGVIEGDVTTLQIGQRVRIVPNHACAVVNGFDEAWLVDGDKVIERLSVDARGKMA